MRNNPLLLIDGYKASHKLMYPQNTTLVYSNYTCRSTKYMSEYCKDIVVFGTQYVFKYINDVFNEDFFKQDKNTVCQEAKEILSGYIGQDYDVSHFEALHDLGYLPVSVKALEEGLIIKPGIPLFTIKNTLPEFFWVTNFLETLISTLIWKPIHSASIAYGYKKLLTGFAKETGTDLSFVNFQGHDFSFRGMQSVESAISSGMGFLTSFMGSDTLPTIQASKHYYNTPTVAFSVPASEHSVMCSHGKESEINTLRYLMSQYPVGILSVVSDTWDLWKLVTEYLPQLKEEILSRDGKLVIRPDCYSDDTQILTKNGWKLFSDLSQTDLVAQVLDDGTHEFVLPLKYVNEPYEGEMIHFYDNFGKIDLLVTPNHRMVYTLGNSEMKVQEASECNFYWNKNIKRSTQAKNNNRSLTPFERLKIAFQADGSYTTSGGKIRFSFAKQRKIKRLENILLSGNIEYKIYDLSDNRVEFNINVDANLFSKNFDWVDISDLCSNWCKEFIEELSYWDATRRSDERFKFDTTTKEVMDITEYIALSAGYGILIKTRHDNRKEIFSDVYTAHILKNNNLGGQSVHKKTVQYKGNIVCVQVPTGRIVVKRNSGQLVCGNSGDPADILCGTKLIEYRSEEFSAWVDVYEKFTFVHENVLYDFDGETYEYLLNEYGSGLTDSIDGISDYIRHDIVKVSNEKFPTITEQKGLVELLWDVFGGTINDKGYKVLDSHIGAIYGDSITPERLADISRRLMDKGFASQVIFGTGSYSLGYATRDNQGGAIKSTYVVVDGEGRNIFKDPITDNGTKKSAKGLLKVDYDSNGDITLYDQVSWEEEATGLLQPIFVDGNFIKETTITDIRVKLDSTL